MIQVWTHGENASFGQCGALDRHSGSQTSFAYTPGLTPTDAVSVTMPTRVKSWDWAGGLAPIFEMNLPEGTLRDRLQRRFAKATGHFDDLDLLSIVGRAQIGRIRYSGIAEALDESVPFQSVDEILGAKRADGLYDYLLEQFAPHSGIAGVQPKVLVRDSQKLSFARSGKSPSIMGATHIVKMWDQADYPQLAANEFFCLTAAKRLGFEVPQFTLSDTGEALVVERFDIGDEGWLGFEDFCVLNGFNARRKYDGSIETSLFKRLAAFSALEKSVSDAKTLFKLIVLNCALGNGDAHLKNFGLLYDRIDAQMRLAPVYDLVTTTAYLPNDQMALTLDGIARWPTRKRLIHLGRTRAYLSTEAIVAFFDAVSQTLMDLRGDVCAWFASSPNPEIGEAIIKQWETWSLERD
jgi:serine/threonine-protein kinase HipA